MKSTLLFIAQLITDSRKPLADRAALCRWARSTAWSRQIERIVATIARDQAFSAQFRN